MAVWMIGVDHKNAGLDVRSVFSFTKKKASEAYAYFKGLSGLSGCVLLSTCNRTEWWISTDAERPSFSLAEAFCGFLNVDSAGYAEVFCERGQAEAVRHLFRLAAGLESQIVGEDQILTQVGEALQDARAAYATDHTLEVLFRLAVTAGKRVKTETSLSRADSSIIHAALKLLEKQGFSVSGKKCLVIGNGMMGRLSAQALLDQGAEVTVTVRQYTSGMVDIPRGCHRIGYAERYAFLSHCDLLASATSSPNYTLERAELKRLFLDHPIILLDLAVPRDIEPEAGELPFFSLYDMDAFDMDALRGDQASGRLQQNMEHAEAILAEEEADFYAWYEGRDLIPRITALKRLAAGDVAARLAPAYRALSLQKAQREELRKQVEGASERMMNHLLFGLRARLDGRVFSECIEAMEDVLRDKAMGNTLAEARTAEGAKFENP